MTVYTVTYAESFGSVHTRSIKASTVEMNGEFAIFMTANKVVAVIKSPTSIFKDQSE